MVWPTLITRMAKGRQEFQNAFLLIYTYAVFRGTNHMLLVTGRLHTCMHAHLTLTMVFTSMTGCRLVLGQVQVLVLDRCGPTSLQFGLGTFFWTGLGPRVAFALLVLFISYKPHFTSATEKESN